MRIILIYVTVSSEQEAAAIVKDLLERRLISCGNVFSPSLSIYRWKDKIETSSEVAIILKSRASLFEKIQDAILAQHSYENPCILSLPVEAACSPFAEWVFRETVDI